MYREFCELFELSVKKNKLSLCSFVINLSTFLVFSVVTSSCVLRLLCLFAGISVDFETLLRVEHASIVSSDELDEELMHLLVQ